MVFLSVTNISELECLHRAASRAITGCLSEAFLPPLRVTLTDCIMSSYKRALRLPTSFPISDLARHGVKPRLSTSSWRTFASTHPLMLPSTSPREVFLLALPFLLGICLPSRWSPLCCLLALAHLDSVPPHNLVLWTDGYVSFPLGKDKSCTLANFSLCGTEAPLSFSAGPVCSSFSAEAFAILQALCWSRQHQQVCHFFSPTI